MRVLRESSARVVSRSPSSLVSAPSLVTVCPLVLAFSCKGCTTDVSLESYDCCILHVRYDRVDVLPSRIFIVA